MVAHKMRSSFLNPDYPILASGTLKRQPKRIEKILKLKFNRAQSQIRSVSLPCWTGDISWFQMSILPSFKTALNWRVAAPGFSPSKSGTGSRWRVTIAFTFAELKKLPTEPRLTRPNLRWEFLIVFPRPKNDSIFLAISTFQTPAGPKEMLIDKAILA